MKTLQECKDEIAIKHNLHSWDNACYVWAGFVKQMEPFMDEAAELYASQFRESSSPTVKESETSYEDAYREGWNDAIKHEKNIKESETGEQEERILESHCGSDFYQLKEQRFLPHIISAMKEHAGIVAEQAFLAGRSKTSWNQFKKDMNHGKEN